jgi:DMSO/TMAO reductase YedYZ heme-binding membrane subunit
LTEKKWELLPFWFPESQINQKWAIVFIILIVISIDWWSWDSSNRINNWIPTWVIYLIIIQFTLAYSVWKFSEEWMKDE